MHDRERGVEWLSRVYAHGAHFTDSIKPRCDKASPLLRPSNIYMCRMFRTAAQVLKNLRFRDLWRGDRAGTNPDSVYSHLRF